MSSLVRLATLAALFVSAAGSLAHAQGTFEVDTNRWGGDISKFQIGKNPLDCQQACSQERRCAAWSYVQGPQLCYLKGSPQTPTAAKGVISGVVRAPGNPPPQTSAVKAVTPPPYITASCRAVYIRHFTRPGARALAVGPRGCSSHYGARTVDEAISRALAACAKVNRGVACRIEETSGR